MFLEKEREEIKAEEELAVSLVFLGNLGMPGRTVIDLTVDND